MTLYIYEQVKFRVTKRMKCADGKTRTRTMTFINTINPFNKNPDGTVRNRHDVLKCVKAQGLKWKEEPITDY